MEELIKLKLDIEAIASDWDGDMPGVKEDRARIADEILEKIKEIEKLLVELNEI